MSNARYSIRSRAHGGAFGPLLIIIVALAMSAAVFFLFTKKWVEKEKPAPDPQSSTQPAAEAPPSPAPKTTSGPGAEVPPSKKAAPPKTLGFARPQDLAQQLTQNLAEGDLKSAAGLVAAGDPSQAAASLAVMEKIKELGYKGGALSLVQTLGQSEGVVRLSIPLTGTQGAPDLNLQIDVVKDPNMGWRVHKLRLPKELELAVAAVIPPGAPMINPAGGPPLPGGTGQSLFVVDTEPDAITHASNFVRALLRLDYETARSYVDESKIPPVKLAGLCIAFEDGKYSLQDHKPMVATVSTETSSWVIAKVRSEIYKEETEFGLEMEKLASGWRIIGLNLSRLLADNARSSAMVGIPYTPLVQNPKGGESIALYFEYDQAVLHPRAQAQLNIVASILKASPSKNLKIGGHTDAKGSDQYNVALSQRRAAAVKQYFLDQGVPPLQVETVGFGKALPLSPNANPDGSDNPEGRSRNRRAEILLDF
ncbi:OmpA family protein [Verrucomicrobium spinosum]|uniref:OmpA family protein n=1 Tax=Verrucomicrobium spinosum TaxID=2736 RepID=UPI0001744DC3|nr:OmpA family protein [Verrucomicrobium spinosum]